VCRKKLKDSSVNVQAVCRRRSKKSLDWQTKFFSKLRATDGFPNEEMIYFLVKETQAFLNFVLGKPLKWNFLKIS